ncbi:MAG: PHP domain-containing protein [Gammaproteobacteria bacterium]
MMKEVYDLHCHSIASDGALTPTELVRRACEQGVTVLGLTDHDTVGGLAEGRNAAEELGLHFVDGIELSATYLNQCLHIVGLNIDPDHPVLTEGLSQQHATRAVRAHKIAEKLEKKGVSGAYESVRDAAGDGEITRSHFADLLVRRGLVKDQQDAFDRYLSKGKSAFVPTQWIAMEDAVAWIRQAGGVAVLAHPLRYNLSFKWMNRAMAAFREAGGQGVEVVTGRASLEDIRLSAQFAVRNKLYASVGSDFHSPDNQWVELGRLATLPVELQPVWALFR